jgi:hypothetical protein
MNNDHELSESEKAVWGDLAICRDLLDGDMPLAVATASLLQQERLAAERLHQQERLAEDLWAVGEQIVEAIDRLTSRTG